MSPRKIALLVIGFSVATIGLVVALTWGKPSLPGGESHHGGALLAFVPIYTVLIISAARRRRKRGACENKHD
jgi:hypothetical protein